MSPCPTRSKAIVDDRVASGFEQPYTVRVMQALKVSSS